MTAGRYEGATAETTVPFPSVVRGSCFFASHVYDWYKTGIQDQAENEVSDCEAIGGSRRT